MAFTKDVKDGANGNLGQQYFLDQFAFRMGMGLGYGSDIEALGNSSRANVLVFATTLYALQ